MTALTDSIDRIGRAVVGALLRQQGLTLTVAESATGGELASLSHASFTNAVVCKVWSGRSPLI